MSIRSIRYLSAAAAAQEETVTLQLEQFRAGVQELRRILNVPIDRRYKILDGREVQLGSQEVRYAHLQHAIVQIRFAERMQDVGFLGERVSD